MSPPDTPQITCEFTTPCTTTPLDPQTNLPTPPLRKVISHIFGRNKTATKQFPTHVWVHYCRKHYQRARYRSTQWPFTQCELIADSLWRMERWGGVRFFDVVLRRREVRRLSEGFSSSSGGGSRVDARTQVRAGEMDGESDADYMDEDDYDDDSDEEEAGGNESVPSPRRLRSSSRSVNTKTRTSTNTSTSTNTTGKGKGKGKGKGNNPTKPKRKTPQIKTAPVPDWLHAEVGPNKTFGEIRGMLRRLMNHMEALRDAGLGDQIRFPDIEILPTFYPWVKAEEENGGGDDGDEDYEEGSSGEDEDEADREEGEVVDRRVTRASARGSVGGVKKAL